MSSSLITFPSSLKQRSIRLSNLLLPIDLIILSTIDSSIPFITLRGKYILLLPITKSLIDVNILDDVSYSDAIGIII